jgi:type II secretory pathway pseudopilin PulG
MFLFKENKDKEKGIEKVPSPEYLVPSQEKNDSVLGTRDFRLFSGFTLVELVVTVGIFAFMTALMVAKYGSFNDTTILTNMAYDVALTIRNAQSYGLNVQGYNSQYNYPYGVDFNMSNNNKEMTFFADSNSTTNNPYDGIYTPGSDQLIATYTLKNSGLISSLCVGTGPNTASELNNCNSVNTLDITFKRPDPNAIIVAPGSSLSCTTNASPCAYAEIVVENAAKTSTRTIVVQETGQIAINP